MNCPKCGGKSYVIDSRPAADNGSVWRERKCQRCKETWITWESIGLAITSRARNDLVKRLKETEKAINAVRADLIREGRRPR